MVRYDVTNFAFDNQVISSSGDYKIECVTTGVCGTRSNDSRRVDNCAFSETTTIRRNIKITKDNQFSERVEYFQQGH